MVLTRIPRLYMSKEDTDLDIVCGKNIFKVHSWLFWPRCQFFKAACKSGFKVITLMLRQIENELRSAQESADRRIELPDDKPEMVLRMIEYFYLGQYRDDVFTTGFPEKRNSAMDTNVEMYALGDKYGIKGLKNLSAEKFQNSLNASRRKLGEGGTVLCAISLVYATTPDTDRILRDIVLSIPRRNWEFLSDIPEFQDFVAQNPAFAVDLIKKMSQLAGLSERLVCKTCKSPNMGVICHGCGRHIVAKDCFGN